MPIAKTIPDYFSHGLNMYVAACTYVAAVRDGGATTRISLGTPSVADTDSMITVAQALPADGAGTIVTSFLGVLEGVCDAPYGRNITAKASAAVGAGTTAVLTIKGYDYLNQPMTETISIAHADAANVKSGAKAFKRLVSVACDGGAADAVTISIGTGDVLGLPFKALALISEEQDGAVQSAGTFVAAVVTDPQTATTGDPRGTYNPTGTLDGTKETTVTMAFDNFVNASGNGGYFGIKQYTA